MNKYTTTILCTAGSCTNWCNMNWGNYLLIPHQIKSIQRSMEKNKFELKVLDATFVILKKLSVATIGHKEKKQLLLEYLDKLNAQKNNDDEEI